MIAGKNKIIQWFEHTGMAYWKVYDHGKTDTGVYKFRSNEAEGITHSAAVAELEKSLGLISYGKYTIVAQAVAGKMPSRGFMKEDFEISISDGQAGGTQPVLSGMHEGYVSKTDVQQQITDALDQYKNNQERETLRKENTDLKKQVAEHEKNDPWARLAGIAADIIPMYKDKIIAQVAGIPQELPHQPAPTLGQGDAVETIDLSPEDQERLSIACGAFAEAAPDEWLEILEKMAAKVRSTPGILNTLKSFL
jgi:hypothetical protein